MISLRIERKRLINLISVLLFLFLISGFVLFSKNFAHVNLKIFKFPFYITELFLLIIIILVFLNSVFSKEKKIYIGSSQKIEFFLFYIIFFISLIRGLINNDILLTLRHSALFYYSIFYFLVPIIFDSIKKIEYYYYVFFFSSVLIALLRIFSFPLEYSVSFGSYYISISIILLLFFNKIFKNKIIKTLILLVILLFLLIVTTSKMRSYWVGIFLSLIFIFGLYVSLPVLRKQLMKIIIIGIIFSILIIMVLMIFFNLYPEIINDVKDEVKSIYEFNKLETRAQRNAYWRLLVWKEIIKESLKKPFLGYGFGRAFKPLEIWNLGWTIIPKTGFTDPHNSYLSFLYRTGFAGLLVFIIIIIRFFKIAINHISQCKDEKIRHHIIGFLGSIIFILIASFFAVVLEGPFLGIFLWVHMGMVMSLINISKSLSKK